AISTELGKLHLVMGETIMASEFYERALHHTRVAVDLDPDNPLWTGDLATSLTAVGNIHRQNGDLSKAAAYQREALRLREEIVRRNPEDPAALEDLAISHLRTAEVLRDLSDLNADSHLHECIRLLRLLLSRDPGRQAWTRLLEEASGLLS